MRGSCSVYYSLIKQNVKKRRKKRSHNKSTKINKKENIVNRLKKFKYFCNHLAPSHTLHHTKANYINQKKKAPNVKEDKKQKF